MSRVEADHPLVDPRDDVLGFGPFAKHLARTLLRNSPADGFVIALHGAWGSGKTTALNFLVHYLNADPDEEEPIIVRFNPWWFSGGDDLLRRFFTQFQAAVFSSRERKKKLVKALGRFADLVAEVPFAPLQAGAKAAGAAARMLEKNDLVKIKDEISAELAKQPARIIVIMDDIDRLVADEVRTLFRLIKGVADFPNVTYVLAFDREVAARALDDVHEGRGDVYLEKIIQAPFELPLADATQLQALLIKRLDSIVGDATGADFDHVRWGNVLLGGVMPFIQKPRDVVRLANALSVTFAAVAGEVDVIDFIALECLRVFSPAAYSVVRANPSRFAGAELIGLSNSAETRKESSGFHEAWLGALRSQREEVRALLRLVFPRLESVWRNVVYGSEEQIEWRRQRRACAPDCHAIYFRLAVPAGDISNVELAGALSPDRIENLSGTLQRLAAQKRPDGSSRATALLDRLNDVVRDEKFDRAKAVPVLHALLDCGDVLRSADIAPRPIFHVDNERRVFFVIRNVLLRLPAAARLAAIRPGVESGGALATITRFVTRLGAEAGRYPEEKALPPEDQILTHDEVATLEPVLIARLGVAAKDGTLAALPGLLHVLELWRRIGDPDDVPLWFEDATRDDVALLGMLELFVQTGVTHGLSDRVSRTTEYVTAKVLERFFDLNELAVRLRGLQEQGIGTERQRAVTRLMMHAIERREQGLSDVDPFE